MTLIRNRVNKWQHSHATHIHKNTFYLFLYWLEKIPIIDCWVKKAADQDISFRLHYTGYVKQFQKNTHQTVSTIGI